MFEINSKPKKLTIQSQVKSGDWMTITKLTSHRRSFSFDEVINLMNVYENIYESSIRILNEYDKVIISTSSSEFCRLLKNSSIVVSHWLNNEDTKNFTTYSGPYNNLLPNIRDFQRIIARHGGVKKWKSYPLEQKDDYTICGKLTLRDGEMMTVAFY